MISRRGFLSALFVAPFVPKVAPSMPQIPWGHHTMPINWKSRLWVAAHYPVENLIWYSGPLNDDGTVRESYYGR